MDDTSSKNLRTPPGFVAVPLKGAVLVIPERVYVAGLELGKILRRRQQARARETFTPHPFPVEKPPEN